MEDLKPELVIEPKKKFMPLKKLDLNTGQFIRDEWHHAIITYFNLKPLFKDQYADLSLKMEDIQNIKKYYGISPPPEYYIQLEIKRKERLYYSFKKLDFYSLYET